MAKRSRLARARKAAGYTQEDLAEALHLDRSTVARWEAGLSEPLPYVRPRLARLLETSRRELEAMLAPEPPGGGTTHGTGGDGPASLGGTGLPVAVLPAAGRGGGVAVPRPMVHPELLGQHELLTGNYRQLDYQAGSAAVYAEVVAQCNRLLELADSVPSDLFRRFSLALGDAAQLAAWLAIDQQNYSAARHYTSLALSSAQEGEDPTLHAYVLGVMSYVHLHAHRGSDAVRLLSAALRLADNPRLAVDPAVRSWLCEALGEAHALAGDRQAGAAALARAERLFDSVRRDDVPTWLGFYDRPEHLMRRKGRCLLMLGDVPTARTALAEAVSALPARYVRERSGTLIDLAGAHVAPSGTEQDSAAGTGIDPEAAAAIGLDAWQLAVQTRSARNQSRIRQELVVALAPYGQLPATQALLQAVG